MPTEPEAHCREHLFPEGMYTPGAESRKQRRGENVSWDCLLDCCLDRPAAFARILDKAGKCSQFRVLCERGGAEIEQPRRNDTTSPPNLGNVRQLQRKALGFGQVLGVLVAQ